MTFLVSNWVSIWRTGWHTPTRNSLEFPPYHHPVISIFGGGLFIAGGGGGEKMGIFFFLRGGGGCCGGGGGGGLKIGYIFCLQVDELITAVRGGLISGGLRYKIK